MKEKRYSKLYKHLVKYYTQVAEDMWCTDSAVITRTARSTYNKCCKLIDNNILSEDAIIESYPLN